MEVVVKKILGILIILGTGIFFLACTKEESVPFENLLSYKHSYVGDNSAVGGIISELPAGETLDQFELRTSDQPYGIIVTYDTTSSKWHEEMSQNVMMYNSAAFFALVDNVEVVTFVLKGDKTEEVHFLRKEVEVLMSNPWSYYYESPDKWEQGLYKPLYMEVVD